MMRLTDDCISREYILSFLDGEVMGDDDYIAGMNDEQKEIREVVRNAPSATPTKRTGKRIVDRYCSECEWDKKDAELVCNIPTNYCPNCGARMKG